jgi:hypothetical protein
LEPPEIIDVREKTLRNYTLKEYLVHWKYLPFDNATWCNVPIPTIFSRNDLFLSDTENVTQVGLLCKQYDLMEQHG